MRIENSGRSKLIIYSGVFLVLPFVFHLLEWLKGGMAPFSLHLDLFVTGIWLTEYLLVNNLAVVFSKQSWSVIKPYLSNNQINNLRIEENFFWVSANWGWIWLIVGFAFGSGTVLYLSTTSLELSINIPMLYLLFAGSAGSALFFVAGNRIFRQLKIIQKLFDELSEIDLWNLESTYTLALFPAKVVLLTLLFLYVNPFFYIYAEVARDPFVAIMWIVFTLFAAYAIIAPLRGVNKRLSKEKRNMLVENSEKIKLATQALYAEIGKSKQDGLKDYDQGLGALIALREKIDSISTWPWRRENLRWIVTALVLPLAIWLAQFYLQRFLGG